MKSTMLRTAALMLAVTLGNDVDAALPGGISGPWFNPDQSGHGLSVNIIPGGRAVVLWHVYDPAGAPLTLYVEGDISGRRIEGVAYAPSGMMFGEFDPATLQLPVWGEVDLEFSDCEHAVLSWRSVDPAYIDGEMGVQRLAYIDGVECELVVDNDLPGGLYSGSFDRDGPLDSTGYGIVDPDGRLWGMERSIDGRVMEIPGPAWVGALAPHMVRIEPVGQVGNTITTRGFSDIVLWAAYERALPATSGRTIQGQWQLGSQAIGRFSASGDRNIRQTWTKGVSDTTRLVAPVSTQLLVGEYTVPLRNQFFAATAGLSIDATGGLCLRLAAPPSNCDFTGVIGTADGAAGVIDFELRDARSENGPIYRGRGWLAEVNGFAELVLVGDDGAHGFGLVGH